MRIFLYEYTCAVNPSASLHAEGRAMLRALAEDFGKIPRAEIATFSEPIAMDREEEHFRQLARDADVTVVIAPELDGILARRCRWVLEAGGRLLGPGPEAVIAAADKLLLADRLRKNSVPYPKTVLLESPASNDVPFPAVCKPRFGAGSQATFLVRTASELDNIRALAPEEMPDADFILQTFAPGMPASVAFLIGPDAVVPLLPARQHLSTDGRFRYQGGEIPLAGELTERALDLGKRAIATIHGLLGYVGVDLILGESVDGSNDYVIEINSRLTTSYVGLRKLARNNLAGVWIDLLSGKESQLKWNSGKARFRSNGSLLF